MEKCPMCKRPKNFAFKVATENLEVSMFHAYIGELRDGRVKITTDRDCLSPELFRLDERVFVSERDMLDCAMSFRNRGFKVCVDTDTLFQDYR